MIAQPAVPAAALSVSPARATIHASSSVSLRVANPSATGVFVTVTRTGLTLRAGGRPALDAARMPRAGWLYVSATRFRLDAHRLRVVRVRAGELADARPGDHAAVLLFSATPVRRGGVAVALRIGVVLTLRAPGHVRRRLTLRAVALSGRHVRVTVCNDGDVDESLGRGAVRVTTKWSQGAARARSSPQRILAHTTGVLVLALPRRARGRMTITARLGAAQARTTAEA